jgi:WD40 repeat protein
MEVVKLLNIKTPILKIKTLANGVLAVIDAHTTVRIVSLDNYKVVGGFKSNIQHERYSGSIVDISYGGDYSISVIPKSNKAALFSTEKKELLYKVGRHQGDIESVAIDRNSRYCVTCGQDGKVFVWALKTARLAFTMPPHADFVTAVAFNDSGQWIATGSFDRTINLLNIATMKQPMKLIGHSSVIVGLVFLPDIRLLSAEREGALVVWDIRTGRLLKRLVKMNDTITAMCISDDKRFVFVGTKLGYVGLYDMQSMELVKQRYLKESEEISSLAFIESGYRLAIGTIEGNIRFYSLFGDQETYMDLLRQRKYKAFYLLLDDNPILFYSKPYELVEKIWGDVVTKARNYLEKGDKTKAKELLDLFSGIPSKNGLITQMLRDYEKYAQFQKCLQEGRLPLAYSMAKQYPVFQESDLYRKIEQRWKKLFSKAQELILGVSGEEQARTLLAPYRGISEKTLLIQQLFAEKRLYEYFKKVISSRNFLKFFDLVKNHPFLKEFSEYTTVMEYADKLYIQAMKGYQNNDLMTAKRACEILIYFPDYSKEATELLETIKVKHLFFDAIMAENLLNAFAYLASYPLLYETPEAQKLENHWNKIVDLALRYAAKGEVENLRNQFEFYLPISAKYSAMGSVFAQCYSVQLEQKLRVHASSAELENGIRNYSTFFGIDEYMLFFFDLYKRNYTATTLELQMLKQGSLETWSPAMIVNDITKKL